MPTPKSISLAHKNLIRRYLIWAYKSTKESFDRLERKTTQLMADEHILKLLLKNRKNPMLGQEEYEREVDAFKAYIVQKKGQPVADGKYAYLQNRLEAVEKTIVHFLGIQELGKIKKQYEEEFTRRIWESKDH